MPHQLPARTPMHSPTPIVPQQGRRADDKRMKKHADLARLLGSRAIPLALLAQRTGAATANAGSIHDTQASIGFSALLMCEKFLVSRASKRSIGLERKVSSGEAPLFGLVSRKLS